MMRREDTMVKVYMNVPLGAFHLNILFLPLAALSGMGEGGVLRAFSGLGSGVLLGSVILLARGGVLLDPASSALDALHLPLGLSSVDISTLTIDKE